MKGLGEEVMGQGEEVKGKGKRVGIKREEVDSVKYLSKLVTP